MSGIGISEIQRWTVGPNDRLVVRLPKGTTDDDSAWVMDALRGAWGDDIRLVVVSGDEIRFSVIAPAKTAVGWLCTCTFDWGFDPDGFGDGPFDQHDDDCHLHWGRVRITQDVAA